NAAWAQHGLHQPQVVARQLAAFHVHGHPSLVVHANQHLHVPGRPRQLFRKALRLRDPRHNVLSDVRGRQRSDVVHAEGPHHSYRIVAVNHWHHVVAVDRGAATA
ncbi:MAG: hypothetical protein ACK55Z_23935, partial [bacterium]